MIASSLFLFFLIPHLYSYFALANLWTLTSTFITVTIISTCYAILSHQATQERVKKRMLWSHSALLLLCLGLILGITTCEHFFFVLGYVEKYREFSSINQKNLTFKGTPEKLQETQYKSATHWPIILIMKQCPGDGVEWWFWCWVMVIPDVTGIITFVLS